MGTKGRKNVKKTKQTKDRVGVKSIGFEGAKPLQTSLNK